MKNVKKYQRVCGLCGNPFEKFSLPMFDYTYRLALTTYGDVK